MSFDFSILAVMLLYTAVVFVIAYKAGEKTAIENFERILEKARKDIEELMNESIKAEKVVKDMQEPMQKFKEEHDELQNKVLHGEMSVEEYVDEYNKLINMESQDMEESDQPGIPHEHI